MQLGLARQTNFMNTKTQRHKVKMLNYFLRDLVPSCSFCFIGYFSWHNL